MRVTTSLAINTKPQTGVPPVPPKAHQEAAADAECGGQGRAIQQAIRAIQQGNNGYADIGTCTAVANAVQAAGFAVIRSTDLHGKPVYRGFTARAQAALRGQPYSRSTYTAPRTALEFPDVEAAILARQESHFPDL